MKKKVFIIIGIFFLMICSSIFAFMKFEDNERIKIAIYPSGVYNESYCFELTPTGKLLVEKGIRTGDELTQSHFIQSESPNKMNIIFEYQKESTRLNSGVTDRIYALLNEINEEPNLTFSNSIMDNWDIQVLYKGKLIKQNLEMEYTLPQINDLVNELISVSPIEIDLHGFA